MNLLVFEHHRHDTPAELGRILQQHGYRLRIVRLYAGEPVPADLDEIDGLISLGGPMNVDQNEQHPWLDAERATLRQAHEAGVPIVGVCLGAQLVAEALGGQVGPMDQPEVGWHDVTLAFGGTIDPIYAGIGWTTTQFHAHRQQVTQLPPAAVPLASSKMCRHQAFRVGLTTYAFQYHFEWNLDDLKQVATSDLVRQAGQDPDRIMAECRKYYDDYRRLGDRLSTTIATVLFVAGRRHAVGGAA